MRAKLGVPIPFDRYIDYGDVRDDERIVKRLTFLEKGIKRRLQSAASTRYGQFDAGFFNR